MFPSLKLILDSIKENALNGKKKTGYMRCPKR